jgi:CheY-like chemotaxis protein
VGGFQGVKFNVLREDGAGETPQALKRRGGSPYRPRKAKCLERKSTAKINTAKRILKMWMILKMPTKEEIMRSKNKLLISIIDNDLMVQTLLVRILHSMNIEHFEINIETYDDGVQFFESNTLDEEGEHLLILDGVMPIMDGIEILQKVRRNRSKHVYVLMLSGRKSQSEIEKALKLGADDYVTKPFSIKELQTRVLQIIQRMK